MVKKPLHFQGEWDGMRVLMWCAIWRTVPEHIYGTIAPQWLIISIMRVTTTLGLPTTVLYPQGWGVGGGGVGVGWRVLPSPIYSLYMSGSSVLTVSLPSLKKYLLPTFYIEQCISDAMYIVFHLSKLWKAKFFILCDIILLVRLQEKFELEHSWEWKG